MNKVGIQNLSIEVPPPPIQNLPSKVYSSTLVQVDARATVVKLYYHERKTVFIVGGLLYK